MKWRFATAVFLVLALCVGGQAFAQTQITSVGTNYGSTVTKVFPIDKEHWVGTQEIRGYDSMTAAKVLSTR